ncbi:MAG: hypothetical protein WC074_01265 [bacterium]
MYTQLKKGYGIFAAAGLLLGTFNIDATPPLGSPVAYALTRSIQDRLSARGVVISGSGQPIVLCAVDWIGIGNDAHDAWREALAKAAGTTSDRVAVHTLHQHDAPRCDFAAEELLTAQGLGGRFMDAAFARDVIRRTASAVAEAAKNGRPLTHIGTGKALVDRVASNRHIFGADGMVAMMRWSNSQNAKAIAAPEGTIDPEVQIISFWNEETPLAAVSYYATHPQSYYGQGDVTAEFVGLARAEREKALPGVCQVHFNGAGGNIAAGKYNDGSPQMRPELARRLADGMKRAWEATDRFPVSADDIGWEVQAVSLPANERLKEATLLAELDDPSMTERKRLGAALSLSWLNWIRQGGRIDISCLHLGRRVHILHLPGELFVDYQLYARGLCPHDTVCMAAYGAHGPSYIGTADAYSRGGYEIGVSKVGPQSERILKEAISYLLLKGRAKP